MAAKRIIIPKPNHYVKNVMSIPLMPAHTRDRLCVNFYDDDHKELACTMHGFTYDNAGTPLDDKMVDIFERMAYNLIAPYRETSPTATSVSLLVIHEDVGCADDIMRIVMDIPYLQGLETAAAIVSDTAVWFDIFQGTTGYIKEGIVTDFELRQMVEGDQYRIVNLNNPDSSV